MLKFTLPFTACGNKLDRSKAAEMIKSSSEFSASAEQATIGVCIGICPHYPPPEQQYRRVTIAFQNALRNADYVGIFPAKPDRFDKPRDAIFLTKEKGQDAAKKWTIQPDTNPQIYDFVFRSKQPPNPEQSGRVMRSKTAGDRSEATLECFS